MTGTGSAALNAAIRRLADHSDALLAVVELHSPYRLLWTSTAFAQRAAVTSGAVPDRLTVNDGDLAISVAALVQAPAESVNLDRQPGDTGLGLISVSMAAQAGKIVSQGMAEATGLDAERAAAALAAKTRFVATVSHEIRTPLTGLMGVVRQLADTGIDSEQRAMVRTIIECAEGLNLVLNDLLDLSRLEAGGVVLEQGDVDLDQIRESIERLYSGRATPGTLRFDTAVTGEGSHVRRGDTHRLMQVLHNLLSNAFKFTNCGSIALDIDVPDASQIVITVRDTGIGMSRDQAAIIFEPFKQADATTARRYGGSGLGLSIVQGLVTAMGGEISVESAPGAGATFRIVLPLKAADAQAPSPASGTAPGALRVLAAEDNAVNRMLLQIALERAGHTVRMAEDGLAVVDMATQWRDDVILMDISLPGRDGDEALALIVEHARLAARQPPAIIAVTAHTDPEDIARLRAAGFADVLSKPYETDVLLAALLAVTAQR